MSLNSDQLTNIQATTDYLDALANFLRRYGCSLTGELTLWDDKAEIVVHLEAPGGRGPWTAREPKGANP